MSDERIDLLVSRAAAGEATEPDWSELSTRAEQDPSLWQRIATAQRDQAHLVRGVNTLIAVADDVDLPTDATGENRGGARIIPFLSWTGWGLAAALAFAFVFLGGIPRRSPGPSISPPPPVQTLPVGAEQALQQYLSQGGREGWVLGEMPTKMLLDIRPDPDGGHELIYLRPILERRKVPELYRIEGEDEQGRPLLLRWEKPKRGAM